jgi:hypothetical protein
MNPTASVIVPNYNHSRYLRKRIGSILEQTYQDFELILLDDGSTDESREILASYAGDPRVRVEFNEKNSGSTFKQWNKGVRLARGEYVWIAESDDYADARLLDKLVTRLKAESEAVFCYCRSWRVSGEGALNGFADPLDEEPERWASDFLIDGRQACSTIFLEHNAVPNASAVLFRREVYERVGGADERLRLGGDWKLWVAMALKGKVAYDKEPLNYYRFHEASIREQLARTGLDSMEGVEVIRSIVQGLKEPGQNKSGGKPFPASVLNAYKFGMDFLERDQPERALRITEEFINLGSYQPMSVADLADAWLRAGRIHFALGRPAKGVACTARALWVRPLVAGRPAKRVALRLVSNVKRSRRSVPTGSSGIARK